LAIWQSSLFDAVHCLWNSESGFLRCSQNGNRDNILLFAKQGSGCSTKAVAYLLNGLLCDRFGRASNKRKNPFGHPQSLLDGLNNVIELPDNSSLQSRGLYFQIFDDANKDCLIPNHGNIFFKKQLNVSRPNGIFMP
jgi:hypothetical protein